MFPWLDLLLVGIVAWGAATGYLVGFKRALTRLCALVAALFIALPFASKCAVYLSPRLEPVFAAGFQNLVIPAGAASILDPWQDFLIIETTSRESLQLLISLAVNLTALCFLMLTMLIAFRLLEKPKNFVSETGGLAAGLTGGVVASIYFLAMAPVLVLGRAGTVLAAAVGESWLANLLNPFVQTLVQFLAPFVL